MVSVRVSDITNPPPVLCSVLDTSGKQQMPRVLASMMSELSLFLLSSVSEAVVENEFRFGNIRAVMFVNVKGMKEVVR